MGGLAGLLLELHVCTHHDHGPSVKAWPGADPVFLPLPSNQQRRIIADRVPMCLIKSVHVHLPRWALRTVTHRYGCKAVKDKAGLGWSSPRVIYAADP